MKQVFSLLFFSFLLLQSCNVGSQKKSSASSPVKDSLITIEDTTALSLKSEIICPKCGHKSLENMPTDVCQIKYVCKSCAAILYPKDGDCCVFCTYGDHKCPSKQ